MRSRLFLGAVILLVLLVPVEAEGQKKKIPRIGFLLLGRGPTPAEGNESFEGFHKGLEEMGYVEGRNVAIEYRSARGKSARLPEIVQEFVRLKVDAIVAPSTPAIRAAKQATAKIPIVIFSPADDPVAAGIVDSLAQPGGNITGVTGLGRDLSGKLLEILLETVPGRTPIGVLAHPMHRAKLLPETSAVAAALRTRLKIVEAATPDDIKAAFPILVRDRAGALMLLPAILFNRFGAEIAELSIGSRLPTISYRLQFAQIGGMIAYGPNILELWRRTGVLAGKVLKGSNPAELPVEQPTRFDFVINLKTASQIGVTIPPHVLARADRVIR